VTDSALAVETVIKIEKLCSEGRSQPLKGPLKTDGIVIAEELVKELQSATSRRRMPLLRSQV
jgi:hypothetical protein